MKIFVTFAQTLIFAKILSVTLVAGKAITVLILT